MRRERAHDVKNDIQQHLHEARRAKVERVRATTPQHHHHITKTRTPTTPPNALPPIIRELTPSPAFSLLSPPSPILATPRDTKTNIDPQQTHTHAHARTHTRAHAHARTRVLLRKTGAGVGRPRRVRGRHRSGSHQERGGDGRRGGVQPTVRGVRSGRGRSGVARGHGVTGSRVHSTPTRRF